MKSWEVGQELWRGRARLQTAGVGKGGTADDLDST